MSAVGRYTFELCKFGRLLVCHCNQQIVDMLDGVTRFECGWVSCGDTPQVGAVRRLAGVKAGGFGPLRWVEELLNGSSFDRCSDGGGELVVNVIACCDGVS